MGFFPLQLLLICLATIGQITPEKKHMTPSETLYPFEGKYIDLEVLMLIKPVGTYTDNFKTTSKYAFRFSAPNDWLNNFSLDAEYAGSNFKINEKGELLFKSGQDADYKKIDALPAGSSKDNVVGNELLLAVNKGVVRASRLQEENYYLIKKYDEAGKVLFEKTVKHTDITVEGNTNYHHPYLYYFGCTPDYLIFTSNDRDYPKTVTVFLNDGTITEYDFSIAGFIRDEDEANVPGFVVMNRDKNTFKTLLLNLSWNGELEGGSCNKAEILMVGEVLYVSFYHGIATGSSLYAFERTTGKLLWQADVKQLLVSHSEYYNTVFLSNWKDYIILEGIEADGHYVQIFNKNTGERLFSTF
jgi:outer membrane protein assembly factor BamB